MGGKKSVFGEGLIGLLYCLLDDKEKSQSKERTFRGTVVIGLRTSPNLPTKIIITGDMFAQSESYLTGVPCLMSNGDVQLT